MILNIKGRERVMEKLGLVRKTDMECYFPFTPKFDSLWVVAEQKISNAQSMFCIYGRLATGLHERNCSKFKNKVLSEVIRAAKAEVAK